MFQATSKKAIICIALFGTLSGCAIKGKNVNTNANDPVVQKRCWDVLRKADHSINQFHKFPQKARGNLMVLRTAFSPQHNGTCMRVPGYGQASQQMLARAQWVVNSMNRSY